MYCIHGFPVHGKLIPIRLPKQLPKGAVVLEETQFYYPLTTEMQQRVCQFLRYNLYKIANGDMLLWAAVGNEKLLVQVELTHDQVYTAYPNPNGKLNVYVVQENG